ncbi:lipase family protein [Mycolicibacterium phlei]
MRRVLGWGAAAVAVIVSVAAVIAWTTLRDRDDDTAAEPGTLVSSTGMPLAATPSGKMHGAKVVYRSTTGDGQPTVVSGTVYMPAGPPPAGGWPVIAVAHPTTGIDENCAPSQSDTLRGLLGFVAGLADRGYAVAVTDYSGLGTPGPHRYLDHRTAGRELIDSVRALRHVYPAASTRWAALGASQGGGAAWSADEQADAYGEGLELVGAVAVAPVADVAPMVDKAVAGTLTVDQNRFLATVLESLARLHPDLDRDDYRRGAVARYWDVLTACRGDVEDRRPQAEAAIRPGELAPADPQTARRLRDYLTAWAVPQGPLTAPLFVTFGERDASIDAQWTIDAVARACVLGGQVKSLPQPDADHYTIGYDAALAWLADRFAGKPADSTCVR